MPVLDSHLRSLQAHQSLPGLQPSPDILLPNYNGLGLASLTPSISRWLGGPDLPAGPRAERHTPGPDRAGWEVSATG